MNPPLEQTRVGPQRSSKGDRYSRHYLTYVFVFLAYVLVHVLVARASPVMRGELIDTDSYLHLVLAGELNETGAWFDRVLARSNSPYGETLQVSRPFHVLLLTGAWALAPFLGFRDALYWSGVLISPVLHAVLAFVIAWATRPFLSRESRVVLMLLLLVQPMLLAYAAAGRADHHILILVVYAASMGLIVRLLSGSRDWRLATAAGMMAGFGIWLSVELLLPLAVAFAAIALVWIRRGNDEVWNNVRYSLGLISALILSLVIERPFAQLLAVQYDRISVVHLAVALIALGFWLVVGASGSRVRQLERSMASRAIAAVAGAGVAAALLLIAFPRFFAGPLAELDPQLNAIFLQRIQELQPLLPTDRTSLSRFLIYIGSSLAAVPYITWRLSNERSGPRWPFWLYMAISMIFFLPAALHQRRFATYVEILMSVALVDLVFGCILPRLSHLRPLALRVLFRAGAAAGLLAGFTLVGLAMALAEPAEAEFSPRTCSLRGVAGYLNDPRGYGDRVRTILVSINNASELLYRTSHRTIGSASHRNSAGILDTYHALATTDERESLRILRERGVDLILLCPSARERRFFIPAHKGANGNPLYRRLLKGDTPDWLRPVNLPRDLESTFKLYEVAGEGASR